QDKLKCFRALWGDTNFVFNLIFEPKCQYADEDCTIWLYHDMHTGKWWWTTQNCTIIPIIISSDKTQLMSFKGKIAYPVYMTISNLPKHI
ncbi:hypothetical protein CPB84DRAFT_1684661, partial [Gymnopilus junonius]